MIKKSGSTQMPIVNGKLYYLMKNDYRQQIIIPIDKRELYLSLLVVLFF